MATIKEKIDKGYALTAKVKKLNAELKAIKADLLAHCATQGIKEEAGEKARIVTAHTTQVAGWDHEAIWAGCETIEDFIELVRPDIGAIRRQYGDDAGEYLHETEKEYAKIAFHKA